MYTNSVMEYDIDAADFFADAQWGPYDKGAIGWTYTNSAPKPVAPGTSITGQINSTTPWNDPMGFTKSSSGAETEIALLSCHDNQIGYTPLCRQHDSGTTPSAIIASQIDTYDWHWAFTNFRVYRKYWDNSHYAEFVAFRYGHYARDDRSSASSPEVWLAGSATPVSVKPIGSFQIYRQLICCIVACR